MRERVRVKHRGDLGETKKQRTISIMRTWGEKMKMEKFQAMPSDSQWRDKWKNSKTIQYKKKSFNIAHISQDLTYLFLMTEQNNIKTLFSFHCQCNFVTSHHRSTWQRMWVHIGYQYISGSVTHSNLSTYVIYDNFTSHFFRLRISTLINADFKHNDYNFSSLSFLF